jgi:hypothetical protein
MAWIISMFRASRFIERLMHRFGSRPLRILKNPMMIGWRTTPCTARW